jgi:threonine aldolase
MVPVDLRSDTVTRPTPAMRRAMAEAEVGDDQYGEDPTVRRLEALYAELVGKEAALFVPSGTMANQIALRLLGAPGTIVLAGRRQHLVIYEHAASAVNTSVELRPIDDRDGVLADAEVAETIEAANHHQPRVSAIFIENTHLASGGRVWPIAELDRVAAHGLPVHLDGARLFNAAVASGESPAQLASVSTTVMSCLSKGLAAPVGSVLASSADLVDAAREHRQHLGGAMRQAGVIAAAGIVALEQMVERLADDHARARNLAEAVADRWPDCGLDPDSVATNMVVFRHDDPTRLLRDLAAEGVLGGTLAPGVVRFVTHCDVDDAGIDRARAALKAVP